jgi:glycosyltransferase 2 family protein
MIRKQIFYLLKNLLQKPVCRISISLAIITFLLIKLPLEELWNTITHVSVFLWIFIVAAFVVGHIVGVIKWNLLVNLKSKTLPFTVACRCYYAGLFANLCLPSLVGGDLIRAGIAIKHSNEKGAVILGSLLDRFLDICALLLIIFMGAMISPAVLATEDRKLLIWFFVFLSCAFLFTISLLFLPLIDYLPKRINELIVRIRNIIFHLIKNPQRALAAFGMALFLQSGFILLNIILGTTCGIHIPISIWFLAWPLAKLSALIPISMGGLGVREVALAVILERFSVPYTNSVGLGLLWETILIAGGILGGFIYLFLSKNVSAREDFIAARSLDTVES